MISVIIPFIDEYLKLGATIANLDTYATEPFELVLIDNASEEKLDRRKLNSETLAGLNKIYQVVFHRNDHNLGSLRSYKLGYDLATDQSDILFYLHSDAMIHSNWQEPLKACFKRDGVNLVGLFGARGCGQDGGRIGSMSNMQGKVWGACDCHKVVADHHGERIRKPQYAAVLDGVGMAFSSRIMTWLITSTDAFVPTRAPHHFYDKMLSLKVLAGGSKVMVAPIEFDHYGGATANSSTVYHESAMRWLMAAGKYDVNPERGADQQVYDLAEQQFFDEFRGGLAVTVDDQGNPTWGQS